MLVCDLKGRTEVESMVLRRTVESKRDDVIRDLGQLHNEELHNLYSLPESRTMSWDELVWECIHV
jgi:hypothetical protein